MKKVITCQITLFFILLVNSVNGFASGVKYEKECIFISGGEKATLKLLSEAVNNAKLLSHDGKSKICRCYVNINVSGELLITSGESLLMKPGKKITVARKGSLLVRGSSEKPAILDITPNSEGGFFLEALRGSESVVFDFARISHCGKKSLNKNERGPYIYSNYVQYSNSKITNNYHGGTLRAKKVIVKDNEFSHNKLKGLRYWGGWQNLKNFRITGNYFHHNGYGFEAKSFYRGVIENNRFSENNIALYLWHCKNNLIKNNIFSKDNVGIRLGKGSDDNKLENCTLNDIRGTGILVQGNNNAVKNCVVKNTRNAIEIRGGNNLLENCKGKVTLWGEKALKTTRRKNDNNSEDKPLKSQLDDNFNVYLNRDYYTSEKNAKVILNLPENLKNNSSVKIKLCAEIGGLKFTRNLDSADTEINISLSALEAGKYPVLVEIMKNGKVISKKCLLLAKLTPLASPAHEVKIDRKHLVALVDGKAFVPVGIIGVPEKYLKEFAAGGFNMTLRWYVPKGLKRGFLDNNNKAEQMKFVRRYLDKASDAGLFVMENPSLFTGKLYRKSGPCPEQAERFFQRYGKLIFNAVEKHPALLAYFSIDEPDRGTEALTKWLYDTYRRMDPYHPVYVNFLVNVFGPDTYDIGSIDNYSIGKSGDNAIATYKHVKWMSDYLGKFRKPYWHIPLCERSSGSERMLNGPLQRIQSYLAIIGGAKGIIWWIWPPTYKENWDMLKQLAGEFRFLAPVIAQETLNNNIEYTRKNTENTVKVLLKEYNGEIWMITANASAYPVRVKFNLPWGFARKVEAVFTKKQIKINDNTFEDIYEGYGRCVYKLKGKLEKNKSIKTDISFEKKAVSFAGNRILKNPDKSKSYVLNSGFEKVSVPGWPDHWNTGISYNRPPGFIGEKNAFWGSDRANPHSGKTCLRMQVKGKQGWGVASQVNRAKTVLPGTYLLSLWLRSDKPDVSVYIRCLSMGKDAARAEWKVSPEWKRYEKIINVKERKRWFMLDISLRDNATVWIDDVKFVKKTSP